MAQAVQYVCQKCGHIIETWSDGNPYYIDKAGAKKHAYHPDHKLLDKCIGNDTPHICLACGHEFLVDSQTPVTECPKCRSKEIVDTYSLNGKSCPYCKSGFFSTNPNFICIS